MKGNKIISETVYSFHDDTQKDIGDLIMESSPFLKKSRWRNERDEERKEKRSEYIYFTVGMIALAYFYGRAIISLI